jgi:hypothetical protein
MGRATRSSGWQSATLAIDIVIGDHKNPHAFQVAQSQLYAIRINVKAKVGMFGAKGNVLIAERHFE